jgi:hypothetical protein
MNCQLFSTGFNSGDFGGNGTRVMLPGVGSFFETLTQRSDTELSQQIDEQRSFLASQDDGLHFSKFCHCGEGCETCSHGRWTFALKKLMAPSRVRAEIRPREILLSSTAIRARGQLASTANGQYEAICFSTCPDPRTERDGRKEQSPFQHRVCGRR